jgi:hypothetical protein
MGKDAAIISTPHRMKLILQLNNDNMVVANVADKPSKFFTELCTYTLLINKWDGFSPKKRWSEDLI